MYRPSNHHERTPSGLVIPVHATLKGRVRWQVLDERMAPEVPRTPSGFALGPADGVEQPNLITDLGLDQIAAFHSLAFVVSGTNWRNQLAVGTGSATPDPTDTTLDNEVQRAASIGSFAAGTQSYVYDGVNHVIRADIMCTRVVTMNADRNLTEFGFSPAGSGDIGIRELLRDGGGSPITVSLLNGKTIRVDHTLTAELPAPAAGTPATIAINEYDAGNNLINTIPLDVIYGPHSLSTATSIQRFFTIWNPAGQYLNADTVNTRNVGVRRISATYTYSTITTPTSQPASASQGYVNIVPETYTTTTHQRIKRGVVPVGSANADWYGVELSALDDIQSGFAMSFDDPATYTKMDTDTLRVGVISTWARA